MIVSSAIAAVAWSHDRPDEGTWRLRYGSTFVASVALGGILVLQCRRDASRDFLAEIAGTYFTHGGFGFALAAERVGAEVVLKTYFLNQHARPCTARIALRTYHGPMSIHRPDETVAFEIPCGPGAFGTVTLSLSGTSSLLHVPSVFEVGVSVSYPDGRGRRLRFQDGIPVRTRSDFSSRLGAFLSFAGVVVSHSTNPRVSGIATVELPLPPNLAAILDPAAAPTVSTLWTLGDPPELPVAPS